MRIIRALVENSPQYNFKRLRDKFAPRRTLGGVYIDELQTSFSWFNTSNLIDVTPPEFQQHIQSLEGRVDPDVEGFSPEGLDYQRDLSIKFHWGHDHDFGKFQMIGRMGRRHIELLNDFCEYFSFEPNYFSRKSILDIGCWTGGTTLLFQSLGASVFAVEEVKKYAEVVSYVARAFGIESSINVKPSSLYSLASKKDGEFFDVVYFPGVLYHLSDPVLALRILYNQLSVGGLILVESAGLDDEEPRCLFEGSRVFTMGDEEQLNRGGWNWFLPSQEAMRRMIIEGGFDDVRSIYSADRGRLYGIGYKRRHRDICRAGLSVPDID